jgi:Ca2+:H+ antiporter
MPADLRCTPEPARDLGTAMESTKPPSAVAHPPAPASWLAAACREWPLAASLVTVAILQTVGSSWLGEGAAPTTLAVLFVLLFAVILFAAFAVVHHAEEIAHSLGEPLGTLILTMAVTGIEVMMIVAVMYSGHAAASLARDAMFSVVMIVLNGMVGLSLILGGLRYHEQTYNLQGANAFLALIVPLSVLGLVLPNYTTSTPAATFSDFQAVFLIVMSSALYIVFLAIQNLRHRDYFVAPGETPGAAAPAPPESGVGEATDGDPTPHGGGRVGAHAALLVVYLLPMVLLAKKLAIPINYGIEVLHAPPALSGFLVAVLVLSPESVSAARAALANQLQRSVNILLGSALATIGLTIPAVLVIGFITGQSIVLGLAPVDVVLLLLTLALSFLTFASARTNVLLGAVHLLLFFAYLMLMFER